MNSEQLKIHLDAMLAETDKRYVQRFESQEKAVRDALIAQGKTVDAAFAASEKAIAVAETNAEKWRVNANEWREAMNDRERNFLSKGMGYVIAVLAIVSSLIAIVQAIRGAGP